MKKSIIFTLLLLLCSMGAFAQNNTTIAKTDSVNIFLDNFKKFVTNLQVTDSTTAEQFNEYDLRYKNFNKLYTEKYKKQMTNQQISNFTQYRTRYRMKVLDHNVDQKTGKLSQKADTLGQKVGEGLKKAGSEIEGFVKGIFKKD